jgi:ABC-type transport system involved in multi-copper enzyme maturation permease subunit
MSLRLESRDAARWRMRARQTAAVVGLELGRLVRGRRLIAVYLLNLLPVLALVAAVIVQKLVVGRPIDSGNLATGFAVLFSTFMMRCMIFFSCVAVFVQLLRGEVMEKTLHYYLLSPVRREVVIVGKFVAGLIAVTVLCCASVLASHLLTFSRLGGAGAGNYYSTGPGVAHLLSYLAATVLACIGYGAVFTLLGVLLRNPMIPALLLLGWEGVLFLMPQFLKQLSVAHYVTSLVPVRMAAGPLAVLAEPTSPLTGAARLLALALVAILIAARQARHLETSYATD